MPRKASSILPWSFQISFTALLWTPTASGVAVTALTTALSCPGYMSVLSTAHCPAQKAGVQHKLVDSTKERTSQGVGFLATVETQAKLLPHPEARSGRTCYLQFPPGVELLQAVHGLLSVHARGHGGPVLGEGGERSVRGGQPRRPSTSHLMDVIGILGQQFFVLGEV